jgi:hypothetical protein
MVIQVAHQTAFDLMNAEQILLDALVKDKFSSDKDLPRVKALITAHIAKREAVADDDEYF